MDYTIKLKHHYKPAKGWINDPNGLVCFKGYYHVFYQHLPNSEKPGEEEVYWGHARTKDFLTWEELPIALCPDMEYDMRGCWSGTAIVKDDTLYLFYASVRERGDDDHGWQSVSVAYSTDGINFKKYENNPVIEDFPADGSSDFRDPAVAYIDGKYYCVMASGYKETKKARLLLYESENLLDWKYNGIMSEWDDARCAECPSFMESDEGCVLATSVLREDFTHYFSIMQGSFDNGIYTPNVIGSVDRGPDCYAGQVFKDDRGRIILIAWIPGWNYCGYAEKDVGCLSVPRQILIRDGKICGYPVEEVQHLLKDSDPAVKITDEGFEIERTNRETVVYRGKITDLKILRDGYILEVFVNGGQEIYSVLL